VPQRLPTADRRPWYADGIHFECQQSGKCCSNHGDYSFVYLKSDDERRLAANFGLSIRAFRGRYTELQDGWRVLLSTDHACTFLDGHGCEVYEARPVQCQTWPFWDTTLDEAIWKRDVVPFCAGIGHGRLHGRDEIELAAAANDLEDDET